MDLFRNFLRLFHGLRGENNTSSTTNEVSAYKSRFQLDQLLPFSVRGGVQINFLARIKYKIYIPVMG